MTVFLSATLTLEETESQENEVSSLAPTDDKPKF